jgi:hypothetical protein
VLWDERLVKGLKLFFDKNKTSRKKSNKEQSKSRCLEKQIMQLPFVPAINNFEHVRKESSNHTREFELCYQF